MFPFLSVDMLIPKSFPDPKNLLAPWGPIQASLGSNTTTSFLNKFTIFILPFSVKTCLPKSIVSFNLLFFNKVFIFLAPSSCKSNMFE